MSSPVQPLAKPGQEDDSSSPNKESGKAPAPAVPETEIGAASGSATTLVGMAVLYGLAVSFAAALLLQGVRLAPAWSRRGRRHAADDFRGGHHAEARADNAAPHVALFEERIPPENGRPPTMEQPYRRAVAQVDAPTLTSAPVVEEVKAPVLIRVLDQVTAHGPGGDVDCSRGKDVADLLGLLVAHRGGLSRDKAYSVLWPDVELDNYDCFHGPKGEIRDKLVRALGAEKQGKNLLLYAGGRYRLNPKLITTDLWQVQDALAEAKRTDNPETAAALLHRAVGLYAGPFLPVSRQPWVTEVNENLRGEIVQALLQLSDLESDADRVTAVLDRARRLDPANEQLACRTMRHFSDLGRNDAVYATYHDLCQVLEELDGLKPSARTTELYGRLTGNAP